MKAKLHSMTSIMWPPLIIGIKFMLVISLPSSAASLSTAANPTSTNGNETDKIALLAFKDFIIEDPLGSLSSWNDSVHLCEWHGVKCSSRHQRVVELNLSSQKLAGSISPFIGNLTFLRSIYIQDNQFRGNIPQEIGNLFRLQKLNFTNNTLQGEIPSNLSRCSDLRVIYLTYNDLVGEIPATFGSLSKLTYLMMFSNNLHGIIPPFLGNLSFLTRLSLGANNLEGNIPDSIGHLTNLQFFGISQNNISGTVPSSIYNISSLIALSIVYNDLKGSLPWDVGLTLPSLRYISVGGNKFTGSFPASFSNTSRMILLDVANSRLSGPVPFDLGRRMTSLRWLNLGSNNLGTGDAGDLSFIESLTNCTNLKVLGIDNNGFGGVLPDSFTNLSTQLRKLAAGGNQLFGNIPAGISKYVNLIELHLGQTSLSGSIPFSIGKLQNLQLLDFSRDKLCASIPESIGNLTLLFQLNLEENNLTGNIPESLKNLTSLQILNLSCNHLGGSIPKAISLFSTLLSISFAHNNFSGSLPLELGSLSNIEELDFSENMLSGEIPSTIGKCLRFEHLLLGGNMFRGRIPPSFGSLKGIIDLNLSHNNLSGTIPKELETLPFLENLNLSFNNFEGQLPSKGVFTNTSVISIVGNWKLCGGVPELHLPACAIKDSKKQNHHLSTKFILIIVCGGVCLILVIMLLAGFFWRRKPRRPSLQSSLGEEFLRISYDELLRATDGFSSANLIGVGSFSSVYRGKLLRDQKPVAVKVFNLERVGASRSFIAECEALRKIRHRNLLKIITACSSVNSEGNDFKALVFELMPNGSLESWLHPSEATRRLDLAQRLQIAVDIVTALDYLHHHSETPIVHCDLKPSNVLLDDDMTAHVGDFGLARFLPVNINNPMEGQSNSTTVRGSIGYVPPEYGMGGSVSTQGDGYSCGILMLEIMTGKRPTDEMFTDGLSLHNFCKMALPDRVMEVVDSRMLQEEIDKDAEDEPYMKAKIRECLTSLVRIGVTSSTDTPDERMGIRAMVREMNVIKEVLLGVGIHGERRIRKNATNL